MTLTSFFFIRNFTSLDCFLPLIRLSPSHSRIIFYQKRWRLPKFAHDLFDNTFSLHYLFFSPFHYFVKKVSHKFHLFYFIDDWLNKLYVHRLVRLISVDIDKSHSFKFFFDHDHSPLVPLLIHEIKKKFSSNSHNIEFISHPHGLGLQGNLMVNLFDYKIPKPLNLNCFNQVFFSSINHSKNFIASNKTYLWPLRYTKYWHSFLVPLFSSNLVKPQQPILVILPSLISNTVSFELKRLDSFLRFHFPGSFRYRIHPKSKNEMKQILGSDFPRCEKFHVVDSILSSSFVITGITSAIYDSILLSRPTIYIDYLTTSIVSDDFPQDFLRYVRCPDELFNVLAEVSIALRKGSNLPFMIKPILSNPTAFACDSPEHPLVRAWQDVLK